MAKNNVWKMTAKDKDGNPVESAKDDQGKPMYTFVLRGPERIDEVKRHAQQLLNVMRQNHFDNVGVDPGYVVDKIEPAGYADPESENVGDWRPAGAKPIDMKYPDPEET